ncbi:methylated-DNA--[protein]-cysteine S-methyltransferase [Salinirubellus sp. GCM10025818]|uniref:methylated-DNA--[protein]-cysteine S-methyltransferase n=1 Tax=Salinirubellus TaxID=2162630 RepID=UPI0030D4E364
MESLAVDLLGYTIRLDTSLLGEPDAEVRRRVREYAADERERFDLTVEYPETFTGRVWARVARIPYGATATYGELATELGSAPVAVGGANARNPLPLVVPCHRVVGADSLRGYRYPGLKERLLRHEGSAGSLAFDLDGTV